MDIPYTDTDKPQPQDDSNARDASTEATEDAAKKIESSILSSYNNIESNLSSWFTKLKTTTATLAASPKTQEYKELTEAQAKNVRERLASAVESGKSLVNKEKIDGYLTDLDKELEIVETAALGALGNLGKYITGEKGALTTEEEEQKKREQESDDDEIDEGESNLLFNVDVETKKSIEKTGADAGKSDDVVVVGEEELTAEIQDLKAKVLKLNKEIQKDTTVLAKKYQGFLNNTPESELSSDESKLLEHFNSCKELTKDEFLKLLSFGKQNGIFEPSQAVKKDDDKEDEEDDDWE
jgi:hypothetical protein